MFNIDPPRSRSALRSALSDQSVEIAEYSKNFGLDELFTDQGEHWSPAGHLQHLNKSVRPLARAMRIPKAVLLLRFGPSLRGSRSFEEVRDWYHQGLASGIQAGPYSPSSAPSQLEPSARRDQILGHWRQNMRDLVAALDGWGDAMLDRCRLPHPALGKMTVLEILYFTLYHNAHHARRIAERRAP